MSTISVVVVDDQELVRAGFIALLDAAPDITVVGEASQGDEGVRCVRALHPDVALVDIRMPVLNGIEAIARIRADPSCSSTAIVVLTTFGLDEYVFAALRAGANAFMLKDTRPDDLLHCVRVVAQGDSIMSPSVTRRLVEEFVRQSAAPTPAKSPQLTDREADILALICEGLSNTQVADRLFIGGATVKTYVSRLLAKFGVETRVSLVIAAYECGLAPRADQRSDRQLP